MGDPGLKDKIYFKKLFFRLLKLILSFCQQLFISILIAAPMLLSMLQYTSLSTRSLLTSADNLFLSLSPGNLLGLFFPDIGAYAEWVVYIGALTIFVFISSLVIKDLRNKSLFWLFLIGLSLFYFIGRSYFHQPDYLEFTWHESSTSTRKDNFSCRAVSGYFNSLFYRLFIGSKSYTQRNESYQFEFCCADNF